MLLLEKNTQLAIYGKLENLHTRRSDLLPYQPQVQVHFDYANTQLLRTNEN